MNIAQRFTLLVKGSMHAMLDSIEDPERSLNQLILDMEEELEAAKRAAARAMANEDVLRNRIAFHDKDASEWQEAAERSVNKGDEERAREALRHVETAERRAARLREQLESQTGETARVRESIARLNEQIGHARARLQVLQAQMRQGEARRAVNRVMRSVHARDLNGEFERIGARVEARAAEEAAYQELDDDLSGHAIRRAREDDAVDEAVEKRLSDLMKRKTGKKTR